MSEIEKMYVNAGIEKCNSSLKDIMPDICLKNNKDENCKCKDCEHNLYPNFTAVKQLELIKWLSIEYSFVSNYVKKYDEYILQVDDFYSTKKDFSNALANLIILIWQDLTEQERTEIANILRG